MKLHKEVYGNHCWTKCGLLLIGEKYYLTETSSKENKRGVDKCKKCFK